ncbi:MAG: SpaA isopeptide-forming pilin-related protein [Patescibacteria group bacterium]
MNLNTVNKTFTSIALFGVMLFGAWVTFDTISAVVTPNANVAEAFVDCVGCTHYVDGPGFIGGGGGWGGGGGEGGGGGGSITPTCSLWATPNTLASAGPVTLNWHTTYASSISIDKGVLATQNLTGIVSSGTKSVQVGSTITYTATVKGTYSGTATCSTTVTVTPPPNPPICTLDLTKDAISWTSNNANTVTIVPLTNSPQVPGATGGSAGGVTVFSGDFGTFKTNHAATFQTDATTYGGVTLGNASFKANKATADRLCSIVYPGSVNGTFQTDTFSSPGNNTIALWNGSAWSVVPASGNDPHLRYNFTCVTASSGSTYPLSGSHNFVPPLGVGTHTYLLTATGPGGSAQCQKTVIVPPPPGPGCIKVKKETYDTVGNILTPVAQFTFKLDGGTKTVTTDANGDATFTNVTPGNHTVTEIDPGSAWELVSVTPTGGVVNVPAGSVCAAVVFKNKQVLPPPPGDPICTLTLTKEKLTWNTTNVSSVVVVPLTSSPTVGVNLPVDGSKTFNPVLGVGTHTYKLTGTGPTNKTVTCTKTIEIPPPDAPNCTLSANKTTITTPGEAVIISYTADNIIKAVLNSVTLYDGPVHDFVGTHTVNPTQTTTYTGTVTGVGGETKTCSVTITYTPTTPAPQCTLTVSHSKIKTGESITVSWTSTNVSNGTITHVGTTTPVSGGTTDDLYPSDTTTYTGTFTGPYGTTTCSAIVEVEKGGGGCQGNCGGGLNQPTVSLTKAPGGQVLAAYVSLAQVPYTGFEAGPLLTALFWLSVVVWSIGISYVVLGKQSMQFIAGKVFTFAPQRADRHEEDQEYVAYDNAEHYETEHAHPAPVATLAIHQSTLAHAPSRAISPSVMTPPAPVPVAAPVAVDGIPELAEVVESRANAAGVLLSPEARAAVLTLSTDRAQTLRVFGDILNEAVRTIPREDGWVLLSSDRLHAIITAQNATIVSAPARGFTHIKEVLSPATVHAVSDSVNELLVSALLTGNRDAVFSLVRDLEGSGVSATKTITDTVSLLDALFRARKANTSSEHVALLEKSHMVSLETMASYIEILSRALETTYSNPFTGFKIALAQAFDVAR